MIDIIELSNCLLVFTEVRITCLYCKGNNFFCFLSNYSVTIPHKEAALKCCDEVDPVAKVINEPLILWCWTRLELFDFDNLVPKLLF